MNLEQLIATCKQERQVYYQTNNPSSPACVEIFRRAFSGGEDAWASLYQLYTPQVQKWIGVQNEIDPEDITQEVWLAFTRYAPEAESLTSTDYLGPIMVYLRRCTKSAILTEVRRRKSRPLIIDNDLEGFLSQIAASDDPAEQTTIAMVLQARLNELIETDQERVVFQLRFVCNIPPREIIDQYPEKFEDYQVVARTIQRLSRRLRKDEILRELFDQRQKMPSSASIENRKMNSDNILLESEKEAAMHQPDQTKIDHQECPYSEEVLLDYITGLASAQLSAEIERTSACVTAVESLRQEIGPWMAYLHRLTCPDEEQLIAYQEKSLPGAEPLIIRRHLEICPLCQEELDMLQVMDEMPLFEQPSLVRRVIEAIFQSPLAQPSGQAVRGGLLQYRTPDLMIHITSRKNRGQPRSWTLRGQLRDEDGLAFTDIEQVELEGGKVAELQSNGAFVFKALPAGHYRLKIVTPESEIVIRRLEIGD